VIRKGRGRNGKLRLSNGSHILISSICGSLTYLQKKGWRESIIREKVREIECKIT
jgi:hypothetical protein